jgi:hypothetical protein
MGAEPSGRDVVQPGPIHRHRPEARSVESIRRRRCLGAAFANTELDVTLATMLREFRFVLTCAPGDGVTTAGWQSRRHTAAGRSLTGERFTARAAERATAQTSWHFLTE